MTEINKKLLKQAQDYVMIFLGLASYAFGFTAFILPEKVVTGGVTGVASLLFFGLGWNVAVTYFIINVILLAIAFRTVGKQFVIRTIIGASAATLLIGFMEPLFTEPIVAQQPFMNVIMMLYMDLFIISSSYIIFQSIDKIVYGLIFMIINSFVADMVINNNRQAVQFMIFSEKWEDIANAINNEAHRGCTLLHGTGWYTKRDVKILLVMCRKMESVHIFRIIKAVDDQALISQSNMNGVYGLGFDEVKVRMHKYKPKMADETTARPSSTDPS